MIEKDKLRDKISFIEKNLRRLGKIGQTPLAGFTEESISYHAAVRLLQVSIEAVIDIGNHIVARERLGVPKTGMIFAERLSTLINQNGGPKYVLG